MTELSNSYREPEEEPIERYQPSGVTVFVCWDHDDYYGPDPCPEPYIFTTLDAAKARCDELRTGAPVEGWRSPGYLDRGEWERHPYSIEEVEVMA